MSRAFCIPGVFFIFCALVLNLLVSISLPFLPGLDIARTRIINGQVGTAQGLTQIRFGIWAPCFYTAQNHTCPDARRAYTVTIENGNNTSSQDAVVDSSWTRGLAVHPVAAIVTFFAFLFSLSTHLVVTLIASLLAFLAALLTLIAFAIDIALLVLVQHELNRIGTGTTTKPSAAFWMTFVSLILLLLGGCTVCLGRRRDRLSGATDTSSATPRKFSWRNRFTRNRNNKA